MKRRGLLDIKYYRIITLLVLDLSLFPAHHTGALLPELFHYFFRDITFKLHELLRCTMQSTFQSIMRSASNLRECVSINVRSLHSHFSLSCGMKKHRMLADWTSLLHSW